MKFIKKTLVASCSAMMMCSMADVSAQEINVSVASGLGYETNIYHAPDHDYIDTSLPSTRPTGGIFVSPEEISSFFIPVDIRAGLKNKVYDNAYFVTDLDLATDLILNSDAEDAARTDIELGLGLDFDLIDWKYSKKIKDHIAKNRGNAYIGAFVSSHEQVYVDRDSGFPMTTSSGGVDISDKYSFQSIGMKGKYERKVGKFEYLLGIKLEELDYKKPLSGAEYDHSYQKFDIGLKREITKSTDLKLVYSYFSRDYSDRHARDVLTGTYSSANDLLKYTYNQIDLSLVHDYSKKFRFYVDVKSTNRTDEFEGYNDYSKLQLALRARYKLSSKTRLRAKISSSDYDYDNAYNFEDATRGIKESSALKMSAKVEHELDNSLSYFAEFEMTDNESTDDRYNYTNNVIMAGVKWEY